MRRELVKRVCNGGFMKNTRTELLCQEYDKATITFEELILKLREVLYPNGELHV